MKTKRTVISMIVVLSVFCLSVVFDIQRHIYTTDDTPNKVDESLATESSAFTEELNKSTTESNRLTEVSSKLTEVSNIPTDESNNLIEEFIDSSIQQFSYMNEPLILPPPTLKDDLQEESELSAEEQLQAADLSQTDAISSEMTDDALSNNITVNTEEDVTIVEEPEEIEALYSNIGISIANSYVNIRKSASTDSEVLGKLYRDSAAEILETDGEWYYVESGSVKGYVSSNFIKTGIPDDEIIEKYGTLSIIVKVDGLNVREEPDIESDKLTVIYMNEIYPVLDLQDEWIKVDITDDKEIGYIMREYTELIVDFEDAISKEEELELLRLKEEERIKKETEVKYRDEVNYSNSDLKLLACLVHSEAGNQSYEGKLAVANIVLNRIKSRKYPNNIKDVIYQSGQFSVASSGSLAKQLSNYDNYSSNSQRLSAKAARAALEGANNIGNRLYFHSYKSALKKGYDSKPNSVKLDDQLFW